MSKPVAGEPIRFFSVFDMRGMSMPLVVLFTSNNELAFAVLPSVLMATDCALIVVTNNDAAKNNNKCLIIGKTLGPRKNYLFPERAKVSIVV